MKVIRAPLRVSLFGGGTDLDPFCSEHGSTIISFAIDKHIYLTWNDRHTGGCRLSYSEVEELDTLGNAKHSLVRETALTHYIEEPCTLTIVSDLPKGTGLGSSSALSVNLAMLIGPKLGDWNWSSVVQRAREIEHAVSHAGLQDYLPATFGSFSTYRIAASGADLPHDSYTSIHSLGQDSQMGIISLSDRVTDLINRYGLLLYTGSSRPADSVLPSWQKSTEQLHQIKALADEVAGKIDTLSSVKLGYYLNQTWGLKQAISGVSNEQLNWQYKVARAHGAIGGKLCGAGAGGCWFFLVSPNARERVKEALGLREIPFQVSQKGVESWEL